MGNQRGVALITAILFLTILSLSWASFYMFGRYEEGMIQNEIRSDQAAYLAEAGVQEALWRLSQDYDWGNWGNDLPSSLWSGAHGSDAGGNYYQWSGSLGDSGKTYVVQIRDDGEIESKVVTTGSVGSFSRVIEVEIGSAFDYGLYSHDEMEFRTRSLTVGGVSQTGYVYSKDAITDLSGYLRANKITGNFTGGPGTFYYFPKAIPLPELWTPNLASAIAPGFEAKIRGTPSPTTVVYDGDTGEGNVQPGDLMHNEERGSFRTIQSVNTGANTIITEPPPLNDNWADNDAIVVERIDQYESQWNVLLQQANAFENPPAPPPYDHTYRRFRTTITAAPIGVDFFYDDSSGDSGEESLGFRAQINGAPVGTVLIYDNETSESTLAAGALLHNTSILGLPIEILSVDTAANTITLASNPFGWSDDHGIFLHNSSFKARINGAPTTPVINYDEDTREGLLKWIVAHSSAGDDKRRLYNATRGDFLEIQSVDVDSNTITLTGPPPIGWNDDDYIEIPLILYNITQDAFTTIGSVDYVNNKITATSVLDIAAWVIGDEIKADFFFNPGTDSKIDPSTRSQSFPEGSDSHAEFVGDVAGLDNVSFFGSTTFNQTVKIDGNALFGLHATSGAGETIISGDLLVDGNAYFFNKVDITTTGRLYVTGKLYMFDNEPAADITNAYRDNHYYFADPPDQDWKIYLSYAADGSKLDADGDTYGDFDFDRADGDGDGDQVDADDIDRYVDVDQSLDHGITIAAGGGIFVRDGVTTIYEMVQTAPLKIDGYFYANAGGRAPSGCPTCGPPVGVLINHGYPGTWDGKTEIKNANTDQSAFFVRNGSLQIGSTDRSFYTDLEGEGRIVVAEDISLSDDLMAPNPNKPLFVAAGGDFYLEDDVASGGLPFYGAIYAGERTDIGGSTDSIVTISRGILTANRFTSSSGSLNPLYGGAINNWDYRSELYALGFVNDKDYVRPLLWRVLE